ncbi:aspartate/glutamate racemase family protein [Ideonella sp. 4Y16]|uniref:Aspartate/glutamate racemase family protein n=1 Tax=Ideonella alba TaxID=2824118 RepID=A0A940YG41_9BURK|nr:aspartate/glutamate racemase family protein [Ideonella alba]MBQ0933548.1 aspartate/glutamate racemase family protein [Ideonella alba]MBQ0946563.1 aspartate/glutamate racemase family protein [Ideonella alba]
MLGNPLPLNAPLQVEGHGGPALGVVGGMGPLAAVKFLEHLLHATPVECERDHIRVLLDNDPRIPDRQAAYRGRGVSPAPAIRRAIEALARQGAIAVAVPCNAAHHFRAEIAHELPVPWLNMIEMVGKAIVQRASRPLVLGAPITVTERLYSEYLPGSIYPTPELSEAIYDVIDRLKLCTVNEPATQYSLSTRLRDLLHNQDCDAVLLSCSELTLLGEIPGIEVPIFDSSREYARLVASAMSCLAKERTDC